MDDPETDYGFRFSGRRDFLEKLESFISQGANRESPLGLLLVKLLHLRRVNNTLGYRVGDALLQRVGNRLEEIARKADYMARIGDSEFAMVLPALKGEGHAILAATKILRSFDQPLSVGDDELVPVELAVGIALFPEHATDGQSFMRSAETALSMAICADSNYAVYSKQIAEGRTRSWAIEAEMDGAIRNGELDLVYQPKVSLRTRAPVGFEALLRWESSSHGNIAPHVFIDIAEQAGKINALNWWALKTALRCSRGWPNPWDTLPVSVNLSATMLQDKDLVPLVDNTMSFWDTPRNCLTLEISESTVMHEPEVKFFLLHQLQEVGVNISIDDFGTGFSSLSYFKDIPVNEVKIDRSFVQGMLDNEGDEHVVKSIIQLAHNFGLRVVAEGVENEETVFALLKLGCDYGQGYYFSHPLSEADLLAWLRDWS